MEYTRAVEHERDYWKAMAQLYMEKADRYFNMWMQETRPPPTMPVQLEGSAKFRGKG